MRKTLIILVISIAVILTAVFVFIKIEFTRKEYPGTNHYVLHEITAYSKGDGKYEINAQDLIGLHEIGIATDSIAGGEVIDISISNGSHSPLEIGNKNTLCSQIPNVTYLCVVNSVGSTVITLTIKKSVDGSCKFYIMKNPAQTDL